MSLTFGEALKRLETCENKRQIWLEVANFLNRFVGDEVSQPERKMSLDDGRTVDLSFIQETVDGIQETRIAPLDAEIKRLKGRKVEVEEDDSEEEASEVPRLVKQPKSKRKSKKVAGAVQVRGRRSSKAG